MRLPLAGQSYTARSPAAAAQTCVNLYPEKIEDPNERAKGIATLYGTPGRHLFATLTSIDAAATPVRGLWSGGGRLFVAAGTKYFELDSAGALVGSVRTIANDANNSPVQFFGNGNQLFIVSAGTAYIDNGSGPVQITIANSTGVVDTDGVLVTWVSGDYFLTGDQWVGKSITINAVAYTIERVDDETQLYLTGTAGIQSGVAYSVSGMNATAVTGGYLDGYFLFNRTPGGTPDLGRQVNFSGIFDGTTWAGLDFFIKEGWSDYIQSILVENEQIYLFGTETFEVWQNVGGANAPFQRIDGAMQKFGSVSPWGPVAIEGRVFFIGGAEGSPVAYVLDGFTPRRISTHAEESAWNAAGLGENCVSYGYDEEGHSFWVINFGSQTWAYDTTTGFWHQRYAWDGAAFQPYPTQYHTYITNSPTSLNDWGGGKHITGGLGGALYESSVNFYDDNGADIKWQRALPYLYNGGNRMYFGRMTLEMQTGTVPSGPAPTITREYSDNRGQSFTGGQTASIGVNNDYTIRVFWPVGGSSRDRVWRFSGVGQYKVALVALDADVTMGTN